MPTKPEGPAQEPQHARTCGLYNPKPLQMWEGVPAKRECTCRSATPAPSQPAGAREQAAIHLVSEAFSAFLEMTDGKPELNTRWMREAEELLCGGVPVSQQTAAKDAEWRRVVESYKTQVDKRQALLDEMPCGHPRIMMLVSAETGEDLHCWFCDYRDQLRDANTLRVAAERERDSLREQLEIYKQSVLRLTGALKAGKE